MIIDVYKSAEDFPFERYFESANQYIQAQSYWLHLLRSAPGFDDLEWHPKFSQVNVADEMYTGRICDIVSPSKSKEITISTASILGDANMIFKENQPVPDQEYAENKELFGNDFELDEKTLQGITYEEALQDAKETASNTPTSIWVEKSTYWQRDLEHSEGGYEMDLEHLVITSEISEVAETKAIQALELFLQPGSAMDRVNSIFSPEE